MGVLVGAFVGAYASTRASIRTQGRAAARLAADGLAPWNEAVEILKKREPGYPRDETYDIYMALDLNAVRPFLTTDWWEMNRAGLGTVATEDQWTELRTAAKVSRGLLMFLADIGNVGEEVWMKRAKALMSKTPASVSEPESDDGNEPSPSEGSDPEMTEFGAEEAEFDRELAELKRESAESQAEMAADLRKLRATVVLLDHRLSMVRDVHSNFIAAGPKLSQAANVCRSLEEATKGSLGLVSAIRGR